MAQGRISRGVRSANMLLFYVPWPRLPPAFAIQKQEWLLKICGNDLIKQAKRYRLSDSIYKAQIRNPLQNHRTPAVDCNHLAGNVSGVTDQKQYGLGDIIRMAGAFLRRARDNALFGHFIEIVFRP